MAGYVVILNGGVISYYASKKLKIVAMSSCEAEYSAASMAAKDLVFVRNLCRDLNFEIHAQVMLYVDNSACIDVCKDPGVNSKTKHFNRAIHFIRDEYNCLRVDISFVPTAYNMVDHLTKVLQKSAFINCRGYCSNQNYKPD